MATKKKLKTFSVGLAIRVWTDVDIQADTIEEALIKARELKVHDVVSFDTPYNDGNIAVSGIHDTAVIDTVTG